MQLAQIDGINIREYIKKFNFNQTLSNNGF